jgi:competence protein ComEC
MLETLPRKPLIPLLLFYTGGILTQHESDLYNVLIPLYHLGLVVLLWRFRGVRWFVPGMLAAFGLGGWLSLFPKWIHEAEHHLAHYVTHQRVAVRGEMVRPIQYGPDFVRFHLRVDQLGRPNPDGTGYRWTDVTGTVRFKLHSNVLPAEAGDRVEIDRVLLYKPRRFQNLGGFDFERWLTQQGVDATGGIRSFHRITLLSKPPSPTLTARTERLKGAISDVVNQRAQEGTAGIIQTMVLGNTDFLSDEDRERFQKSGIAHLLAISGLHLGFIAYFFFWALYPLLFHAVYWVHPRSCRAGIPYKLTAGLTIPLIAGYTFLIGYKVSAVRAAIMIVAYLISVLWGRQRDLLNTLAGAALVILIWNPDSIYQAGFQLSFMAVLGIALALNRFGSTDDPDPAFQTSSQLGGLGNRRKVTLFLAVTLFASLATLPLVLFHFNQLILSGLVLNFIAIPVASVYIPMMFALVLIGYLGFPQAIDFISRITGFVSRWRGTLGEIPGSFYYVSTPPLLSVLAFYLFLLLILYWKNVRKPWIVLGGILLLFVVPLGIKPGLFHSKGTLQIHFLDVGQGDATLIRFPDGQTLLVDGGGGFGTFNVGEGVVEPYLRTLQISRIDYLVATHPDSDHIAGLFPLIRHMKVGWFFDNGQAESEFLPLRNLAESAGARYGLPGSLGTFHFPSGIRIDWIHPTPEFRQVEMENRKMQPADPNNSSVVLRLIWGRLSLLLPGDIEHRAETYLAESGIPLRADVLKVPHHGSRTSSTVPFLESVSPQYAVISCGYRNWHGHPHPGVLRAYRQRGVTLFRTDLHGSLILETRGEEWRWFRFEDWKRRYSRLSLWNMFL